MSSSARRLLQAFDERSARMKCDWRARFQFEPVDERSARMKCDWRARFQLVQIRALRTHPAIQYSTLLFLGRSELDTSHGLAVHSMSVL